MGDWKRHLPIVALIGSVIGIALFDINVIAHGALDHDEIEHAHVAWLMSLGHLPYRDFNQNHMPATWLSTAQLFDSETHTIMPLLTARALCCLAFVVAAAIGLWMLQATDPQTSANERWLFMAVAMLLMVFVQFFRLRPDPFMTLATTGAVACCCRLLEAPRRWACIFGVSMGIAAMFSTKIVAFCLLVPIFSVTYAVERRHWQPLTWSLWALVGFLVGVSPVLAWLSHHQLWADFLHQTVHNNSALVAPTRRIFLLVVPTAVTAIMLLPSMRRLLARVPHAGLTLILATILGYVTFAIAPVQIAYDAQTMLIPASCVVTWAIASLARRKASNWGASWSYATIAVVLFCLAPILRPIEDVGHTISQSQFRQLLQLAQQLPDTNAHNACFAFAPHHPVFFQDATRLYLGWDIGFATNRGVAAWRREVAQAEWRHAINLITHRPPSLVVLPEDFQRIRDHQVLDTSALDALEQVLRESYRSVDLFDDAKVYVRRVAL